GRAGRWTCSARPPGRPWPRWRWAPAWPRRAGPGVPTARRCGARRWASPLPPATTACWRAAGARAAGRPPTPAWRWPGGPPSPWRSARAPAGARWPAPAARPGGAGAAAASGAGRGHWAAGADVAARITWATGLVTGLGQDQLIDTVYRLVGTSLATQESVPAAFAIAAACPGDPWLACRIAASLGGDCDTIAAMTGAICGACHGAGAFPDAARQTVARVNRLDLGPLADDLLAIRTGADG